MFADELLSKKRSFSPSNVSECPSESKKSRSVSPKGKTGGMVAWWDIADVFSLASFWEKTSEYCRTEERTGERLSESGRTEAAE